eukprot:3477151-Pleurochrysis_carterae.AAC.2
MMSSAGSTMTHKPRTYNFQRSNAQYLTAQKLKVGVTGTGVGRAARPRQPAVLLFLTWLASVAVLGSSTVANRSVPHPPRRVHSTLHCHTHVIR